MIYIKSRSFFLSLILLYASFAHAKEEEKKQSLKEEITEYIYHHVQDLLSIRSTGEVHGDVVMSKLIVESGAVFNAKSSMQNDATNIAPLKKITNFNDAREKTA